MIREYCSVRVAQSLRLAIPVENLGEVLQLSPQDISPIPGVAPWLMGAINQKGTLLWVVNLEHFLQLKHSDKGGLLTAVVMTAQLPDLGLELSSGMSATTTESGAQNLLIPRRAACLVLAIEGMLSADEERLRVVPSNLPPRVRSFFQGVLQQKQITHLILDPLTLFKTMYFEAMGSSMSGSATTKLAVS
jgi:chemotaxis signal transduction protein